jgi:hypothetical protein
MDPVSGFSHSLHMLNQCESISSQRVLREGSVSHPRLTLSSGLKGMARNPTFANTPLAQHPFRISQCEVTIGLRHSGRITYRNHRTESYNHVFILTSPSPCAKNIKMGLCHAHIGVFPTISLPDYDSSHQPRRPCKREPSRPTCSLPTLVYNIGDTVDAGGRRGW